MDFAGVIKLLNVVALAAIMLSIGLGVRFEQLARSMWRARLLALAVASNFIIVPVATVALLLLFDAQPLVSAGFLILAVCPGAPMGPPFTRSAARA